MIHPTYSEDIATVRLLRAANGEYAVLVECNGECGIASGFVTVGASFEQAAQIVAEEQRKQRVAADPRAQVP